MVTFPSLGINLKINKIAFSILGIEIYWYAIFIVIAMILSLIILKIITNDPVARSRAYPELYSLLVHLHAKDRFTHICNEYNYDSSLKFKGDDEISRLIMSGYENIDIMRLYGYNHINKNTKLYSRILNTRKILTQVQRSGKPV